MWRILENLYLGDAIDARNRALLEQCGISHILNCAAEVECAFPAAFRYLHLELTDPDPAFVDHIPAICQFIRVGRRRGAVMVHCRMGVSRSVSAILAYLCGRGLSLSRGLRLIRKGVGEDDEFAEPNEVLIEQIRDYFELDEE